MNQCPKCRRPVEPNADACADCGASLVTSFSATPPAPPAKDPLAYPDESEFRLVRRVAPAQTKAYLVFCSAILVALGAVGIVYAAFGIDPERVSARLSILAFSTYFAVLGALGIRTAIRRRSEDVPESRVRGVVMVSCLTLTLLVLVPAAAVVFAFAVCVVSGSF